MIWTCWLSFQNLLALEFIDLADELENLLHLKVDLVSKAGVAYRYLPHIEKDILYV